MNIKDKFTLFFGFIIMFILFLIFFYYFIGLNKYISLLLSILMGYHFFSTVKQAMNKHYEN